MSDGQPTATNTAASASTLRQRRTALNAKPIDDDHTTADADDAFSSANSAGAFDASVVAAAARAPPAVVNPLSAVPASPAAAVVAAAAAGRRRRAADDGDPLAGEMILLLLFVVLILCGAFLILFSPAFQRGGMAPSTSGRKMHDSSIQLRVNLEALVRGETVRFDLPSPGRQRRCPHCGGSGGQATPCTKCGGAGQVQMRRQVAPGFYQTFQQNCAACGGRGKHIASPCSQCQGTGTIHDRAPISLRIPPGAPEGWTATLVACGDDPSPQHVSMGVASGDLVVEVGARDHERFRREGQDLHTELEIQLREAIFGFTRDIQLLDGSTLKVQRDGITLPDSRLTFEGRGMPAFDPAIAVEAEADATVLALGSSRASEESMLGALGAAVQSALRSMGLAQQRKTAVTLKAIPAGDLHVAIKVRWPRGPLSEQQKKELRTLLGAAATP